MSHWGQPMPPGWEAKWDAGQKRYFFINHSTKTTTWVDPRSPQGRQQVAPRPVAPQQPTYPPQPSPQPARVNYGAYGTGASNWLPMQTVAPQAKKCEMCRTQNVDQSSDFCRSCLAKITADEPSSSAASSHDETSFNEPVAHYEPFRPDVGLMSKFKAEYPEASDLHIRSALEANKNDENESRKDLEKRGYKRVNPKAARIDAVLRRMKVDYQSCSVDILRTAIDGCDCNESRARDKLREMGYLTDAEKEEELVKKKADVENKIRAEFMALDYFQITSALEEANYNEVQVRRILTPKTQSANVDVEPEASDSSVSVESRTSTTSPPKSAGKSAGKSKPNKQQTPTPKSRTSTAQPRQQRTSSPAASKTTTVSKNATASKAATESKTAAASSSAQRVQKTAENQKRQQPNKSKTAPTRNATPPRSGKAHGPDQSLAKGPNDNMLIKSYVQLYGPDSSLVRGPTCQVIGSVGAKGPDPSNAHGPAREYRRDETMI